MREVDEDLMKRFRDLEASQEKLREQLDLLICGGGDKKAERAELMAGNFVRNPYQVVLHQLGHALHICRPVSGEIIYWNRSAENLYGWKSYEALEQKITDLLIDINRYPCWESTLERVYSGQTWSGQFPFKKRSGELFMAMLTMSPLNESGICIGVITVSSDASMLNNGSSERTWTHSDEAVGEFGEPKSNFKKVHWSPQLQIASSVSNLVQGPDNARENVKDNAYCASCYRNVVVQRQSSSVSDINSTEEMRNLVSQLNRSTSFAHFRNAIMHNTALHHNGEHLPDDATDKATVFKKNASTKMEDFQPAKSQNSMETSCSSQTGSSTVCEMEAYLVADSEINWEDLLLGEKVGEGSYAVVYRGIWNGSDVAVKVYTGMDYQESVLLDYKKEIAIMKRLRHPNVLLFMGAVYSPEHLAIVTEYLPRGSLFRALHKNNQSLVLRRRVQMALDVARGMNYLHRRNPPIIHRDLKSSNLLVDKNWTVKVGDFGLSCLKISTILTAQTGRGTPQWMAPEVLRGECSSEKSDVFSFGVILWELMTESIPWSHLNSMQVVGVVGFMDRRLDLPEGIDSRIAAVISDCWKSDPSLRPSFQNLVERMTNLMGGGAAPPAQPPARRRLEEPASVLLPDQC